MSRSRSRSRDSNEGKKPLKRTKPKRQSSSSSSDESSSDRKSKKHKEHRKTKHKMKKKSHKHKHKKDHKKSDKKKRAVEVTTALESQPLAANVPLFAFQERKLKEEAVSMRLTQREEALPVVQLKEESKPKVPGPMSKQDYDKANSQIREVRDPKTGRVRLVRGEGEILEQIVSKEEQQKLRRLATAWDGVMTYGAPM